MRFAFTAVEIKEIAIAAAVLSVAFALAYQDGVFNVNAALFPMFVALSFVAVGIGFLAHELIGHKIVAQHFGMHAEFRLWRFGLLFALLSSLMGFVFAAPGAVYVAPRADLWGHTADVSRKRMGIVSIAGPLVNIGLAMVFFVLSLAAPLVIAGQNVFAFAVFINVWLAIFNMIPIPPLDGFKVFSWDRRLWVGTFGLCIALYILMNMLL